LIVFQYFDLTLLNGSFRKCYEYFSFLFSFKFTLALSAVPFHGQYFIYLFYQIYASLQIETEVYEFPIDSFPLVFFLFQNKHVMIEELLKLLVREIDAQLLEAVELRDKASETFL